MHDTLPELFCKACRAQIAFDFIIFLACAAVDCRLIIRIDRPHPSRVARRRRAGCALIGESFHVVVVEQIIKPIVVKLVERLSLIIGIVCGDLVKFSIACAVSPNWAEADTRPNITRDIVATGLFDQQNRAGRGFDDRSFVAFGIPINRVAGVSPVYSHTVNSKRCIEIGQGIAAVVRRHLILGLP